MKLDNDWKTAWKNIFMALGIFFGSIVLSVWLEFEYWQSVNWITKQTAVFEPVHWCPFLSWAGFDNYFSSLSYQGLIIVGTYVGIKGMIMEKK